MKYQVGDIVAVINGVGIITHVISDGQGYILLIAGKPNKPWFIKDAEILEKLE